MIDSTSLANEANFYELLQIDCGGGVSNGGSRMFICRGFHSYELFWSRFVGPCIWKHSCAVPSPGVCVPISCHDLTRQHIIVSPLCIFLPPLLSNDIDTMVCRWLEECFRLHFDLARFHLMYTELLSIAKKYIYCTFSLWSHLLGNLSSNLSATHAAIQIDTLILCFVNLVQIIKNVMSVLWTVLPGNTDIYWRRVLKALYSGDRSESKRVSAKMQDIQHFILSVWNNLNEIISHAWIIVERPTQGGSGLRWFSDLNV